MSNKTPVPLGLECTSFDTSNREKCESMKKSQGCDAPISATGQVAEGNVSSLLKEENLTFQGENSFELLITDLCL